VRARSEPIELNVRPIPAAFTGPTWLPAEQVFLVESWPDDATYRVGEPVTRTLTLRATGLASSQLPEITAEIPQDIRQYPDQPALENRVADGGLVGVRQERVALIPSRAGELMLPEVAIPWWNVRTDSMEVARVPARMITVVPAADAPTPPVAPDAVIAPDERVGAPADSPGIRDPATPGSQSGVAPVWVWVSLGLAVGWLATLIAWWATRRGRRHAGDRPRSRPPSDKQLVAAFDAACDANDAVAAKGALLAWAKMHWPGSPARSLGELAARLDGESQQSIHELSRVLYGGATEGWHGRSLRLAFEAYRNRPVGNGGRSEAELEPLYLR
jgi:hypothetical protein